MQRSFVLTAFSLLFAFLLLSSVSAYTIWEPQYESYRLNTDGRSNGAYSSVSTYEKVVVENEDRFSSDKVTTIKKSEFETYIPTRTVEVKRVYDSEYDAPRYRYLDSSGRARDYYRNDYYPGSNWRYKESYKSIDYPNENSYGYDYYYAPRYDWHRGFYNWRY